MRKTKIVCTLGPASTDYETIKEMALAGMNVVRINMSHGTYEEHAVRINNVKRVREELNIPIALLLEPRVQAQDMLFGTAASNCTRARSLSSPPATCWATRGRYR